MKILIDPDIRKAETLPSYFYRDDQIFESCRELIFKKCWHLICETDVIKVPGQTYPFTLLEGFIDEPLLLTRDMDDKIHCLSNVCTHRGNILIEAPSRLRYLQCRYHGRRFSLDGKFISMPEMENAADFPSEKDNLSNVECKIWNKFIFISPDPAAPHDDFFGVITKRLEGVYLDEPVFEPSHSRDYLVKCNWALYVENYLEGFHIPFIHKGLNEILDYGSYRTELYNYSVLQLGVARTGELCFRLNEISPDYGNEIAAYYWWIFPNLMLNYYPWGISVNIVKPVKKDLTKVSYLTYISDRELYDKGAGSSLDRVEREDQAIVETVQKGMNSSYYSKGRYSPEKETGVHHFHRLISEFLNEI
jgi:choline monooxygenase